MEKRINDVKELEHEVRNFVQILTPTDTATLVTLSGELGAGKTTFTQLAAKALGVTETVTSPTFVLEKLYDLPGITGFKKLIHIDAYRLKSGEELKALDFAAHMQEPENLILLEWPERVADALPTPALAIMLTPEADGSRTLSYIYGD